MSSNVYYRKFIGFERELYIQDTIYIYVYISLGGEENVVLRGENKGARRIIYILLSVTIGKNRCRCIL